MSNILDTLKAIDRNLIKDEFLLRKLDTALENYHNKDELLVVEFDYYTKLLAKINEYIKAEQEKQQTEIMRQQEEAKRIEEEKLLQEKKAKQVKKTHTKIDINKIKEKVEKLKKSL